MNSKENRKSGDIMTEEEKYAVEWYNSAQYLYEHNSYKHLAAHIKSFETVLEIGCGTGQSTLALLEAGHRVIAIDQNAYCIERAKKLIESSGYSIQEKPEELSPQSVSFIKCDVTTRKFELEILPTIFPDVVICWNVGSYWDKVKINDVVPKMYEYGLSPEHISKNFESSYGELMIWRTCTIAKAKQSAVHIVDRTMQKITRFSDPYYSSLKREFNFQTIKYANLKGTSLSKGGRQLIVNGKVTTEKEVSMIFASILMA